ncbi:hypothetical protein BJX96DRAFT_181144 [Aspergillus floccosus]
MAEWDVNGASQAQQQSPSFPQQSPASSEHEKDKNNEHVHRRRWKKAFGDIEPQFKEWTPPMLRAPTLAPLAIFCFGMIAALEAFDYVTRTHVLSPQDENAFNLARYMPTLGVIAIGYVFKGIVADLKKMTPWSNMTGKWTTGKDSVLLDYVNDLEIVSVFSALRRKHWVMSTGLIVAFICGALVPFANSLTYIDLFASRNVSATFVQASSFSFDEHPLAMADGSLKIPWNYTGALPYARVYSEQQGNNPPALWTTGPYAFDQFTFQNESTLPNATLTADVNAISASLDCHQVRYDMTGGEFKTFVANPDDLKAAECPGPVKMVFGTRAMPGSAWLNVTQCSDNDVRLAANFLSGEGVVPNILTYSDKLVVKGLLCSPRFNSQQISLSVNATTNEITALSPTSEPHSLDIKTSTEALVVYLLNPLDTTTQSRFGQGTRGGPFDATAKPMANIGNISAAAANLLSSADGVLLDVFMSQILDPASEDDTDNLDHLEIKVTDLASRIWAELISFLARTETSKPLPGTVTITEQRVLLREFALRAFEALLAVIGIFTVVFMVALRPRTVLNQDPGPLGAVAAMLSTSDKRTETQMAKEATTSERSMRTTLQHARFSLQRNPDGGYGVTMIPVHEQDNVELVALDSRKFGKVEYHAASSGQDTESASRDSNVSKGWRPIPLRLPSKIALPLAIIAVMIALAIMLWQSNKLNGICRDTQASSTALTLVTSALLVLLGYCCAGVDAAAQSLAPFNVMRKRPNQHSLFTDDLSFFGRFAALGSRRISIALLASAAYLVIIPALKLVAAGLYSPVPTQATERVDISVDTSLVTNLEKTFNNSYPTNSIKTACQFTEWESIPQFDLPSRSGIIGNLVLSNMTTILDRPENSVLSGGSVEARVPAIAIDVQCETISSENFNVSIKRSDAITTSNPKNYTFGWYCATDECQQVYNTTYQMTYLQTYDYYPSIPYYVGGTGMTGVSSFYGPSKMTVDVPYWIYLVDYSSLGGSLSSFHNMTPISNETITWGNSNTLSVSLPRMIGAYCTNNLSVVHVNATFARPTQVEIGGGMERLSWRPISVDTSSIVYERPYPKLKPYYFAPPFLQANQYVQDNDNLDGKLVGDSLWPSRGSSKNMFELLASDAQNRVGNLSHLLDPDGLADSARHVYTQYTAQLLTELRSATANATLLAVNQTVPATLTYPQPRMRQDARATYVIEALLAAVICSILLIFQQFPSKGIIPKPPGSIAARFSLLANSNLVGQMRQTQVTDLREVRKWGEPAALGWWQTSSHADSGDNAPSWRWGVDIGRDVVLRSWEKPPLRSSAPSAPSEPSAPQIPLLHLPQDDILPLTASSRRSSVSSLDDIHERRGHH